MTLYKIAEIDDTIIYDHDVETLNPGSWVNDAILHFHGRVLIEGKTKDNKEKVLFVPPCTVQYIRFYDAKDVFEQWKLNEFKMVFFPLTNGISLNNRGSHWSLLVWFPHGYPLSDQQNLLSAPLQPKFAFLDSIHCNGKPISMAKELAHSVTSFFFPQKTNPDFQKCSVPRQNNCYDCGVYLMAFEDYLASNNCIENAEQLITSQYIKEYRDKLQKFIINFGKKN